MKKNPFLNLRYYILIFIKKNKISQYELIKKDPFLNLKYSIFG